MYSQTKFRNLLTTLQLFANSFFPSSIESWDKLSLQLRNAPTLITFKQATKNQTIKPPKFYNAGCRILNIIHTRLRHRSSSLNADLFRVHLANDPGCICGCAFEDAIHFIIRMLSLQRSKRRIEIKTSFSSWTKNWSPTFWRWHLNWDAKSTNFQLCITVY